MNLSQDFVYVNGIRFPSSPPPFLVSASTGSFGLGNGLLGSFGSNFGWHFVRCVSFDIQRVNVGNFCDFPFILRKRIERYN